jgi:hypothetical protein
LRARSGQCLPSAVFPPPSAVSTSATCQRAPTADTDWLNESRLAQTSTQLRLRERAAFNSAVHEPRLTAPCRRLVCAERDASWMLNYRADLVLHPQARRRPEALQPKSAGVSERDADPYLPEHRVVRPGAIFPGHRSCRIPCGIVRSEARTRAGCRSSGFHSGLRSSLGRPSLRASCFAACIPDGQPVCRHRHVSHAVLQR